MMSDKNDKLADRQERRAETKARREHKPARLIMRVVHGKLREVDSPNKEE